MTRDMASIYTEERKNVSINKNILSDDMIQLFEANNIKINIWTINNKDQLYNFTNKGIKIVTSDDALWKE